MAIFEQFEEIIPIKNLLSKFILKIICANLRNLRLILPHLRLKPGDYFLSGAPVFGQNRSNPSIHPDTLILVLHLGQDCALVIQLYE